VEDKSSDAKIGRIREFKEIKEVRESTKKNIFM
jgi:hypothetical protein